MRTFQGTRYGRSSSGDVKRSRMTASCAAANASSTPKLKSAARKATSSSVTAVIAIRPPAASTTTDASAAGEMSVRLPSRPNVRQHPVLAERVREATEPGHEVVGGEDEHAGHADEDTQCVREQR